MNLASLVFRFRSIGFLLLYLLGFLPPWERTLRIGHDTLWLAASTELARSGWFSLAGATLGVTLFALACLTTGTVLRLVGQLNLTGADGGVRSLRHPLSIGSWLLALGTSLLMPLDGALFFLPAGAALTLILVFTKKGVVAEPAGNTHPRLLQAFLTEIYPVAFTVCFAVFAWRYNAQILIKALLICYGLSLVVRALFHQTPEARRN